MKRKVPFASPRIAVLAWLLSPALLLLSAVAGTSCRGDVVADEPVGGGGSSGGQSGATQSGSSGGQSSTTQTSATNGDAGASGDNSEFAACGDASGDLPPLVDAAQCPEGQLVAATPVTIVTPDEDPANPALASSPSGDRFLAAWTDGGWVIGDAAIPERIWASLVQPSHGEISVALELTGKGTCPVAAWNGKDFTVVWGDDSGLRSQEIDGTGARVGSSTQVLSKANANACPASLIASDSGLAVAWYEGQTPYSENVGLIGPSGEVSNQVLLDTGAPGAGPNATLAQLQGRTYVAFVEWADADSANTVVSEIDWAGEKTLRQTVQPGFFSSFLAAGDELWLAAGTGGSTLYRGIPGSPFRTAGESCAYSTIATDACGRLVGIGAQGDTPAGIAIGFFARPLGWPSPPVMLGSVTGSAIAGASSTFGVLWYSRIGPGIPEDLDATTSGALSFTTLSWK